MNNSNNEMKNSMDAVAPECAAAAIAILEGRADDVREHLASCSRCRELADDMAAVGNMPLPETPEVPARLDFVIKGAARRKQNEIRFSKFIWRAAGIAACMMLAAGLWFLPSGEDVITGSGVAPAVAVSTENVSSADWDWTDVETGLVTIAGELKTTAAVEDLIDYELAYYGSVFRR